MMNLIEDMNLFLNQDNTSDVSSINTALIEGEGEGVSTNTADLSREICEQESLNVLSPTSEALSSDLGLLLQPIANEFRTQNDIDFDNLFSDLTTIDPLIPTMQTMQTMQTMPTNGKNRKADSSKVSKKRKGRSAPKKPKKKRAVAKPKNNKNKNKNQLLYLESQQVEPSLVLGSDPASQLFNVAGSATSEEMPSSCSSFERVFDPSFDPSFEKKGLNTSSLDQVLDTCENLVTDDFDDPLNDNNLSLGTLSVPRPMNNHVLAYPPLTGSYKRRKMHYHSKNVSILQTLLFDPSSELNSNTSYHSALSLSDCQNEKKLLKTYQTDFLTELRHTLLAAVKSATGKRKRLSVFIVPEDNELEMTLLLRNKSLSGQDLTKKIDRLMRYTANLGREMERMVFSSPNHVKHQQEIHQDQEEDDEELENFAELEEQDEETRDHQDVSHQEHQVPIVHTQDRENENTQDEERIRTQNILDITDSIREYSTTMSSNVPSSSSSTRQSTAEHKREQVSQTQTQTQTFGDSLQRVLVTALTGHSLPVSKEHKKEEEVENSATCDTTCETKCDTKTTITRVRKRPTKTNTYYKRRRLIRPKKKRKTKPREEEVTSSKAPTRSDRLSKTSENTNTKKVTALIKSKRVRATKPILPAHELVLHQQNFIANKILHLPVLIYTRLKQRNPFCPEQNLYGVLLYLLPPIEVKGRKRHLGSILIPYQQHDLEKTWEGFSCQEKCNWALTPGTCPWRFKKFSEAAKYMCGIFPQSPFFYDEKYDQTLSADERFARPLEKIYPGPKAWYIYIPEHPSLKVTVFECAQQMKISKMPHFNPDSLTYNHISKGKIYEKVLYPPPLQRQRQVLFGPSSSTLMTMQSRPVPSPVPSPVQSPVNISLNTSISISKRLSS